MKNDILLKTKTRIAGPQRPAIQQVIPTFHVTLDYLLGGGWPIGGVSEIYGPPYCGKSEIALLSARNAQLSGKMVAVVDSDHEITPESLKGFSDDLIIVRATGEDAIQAVSELLAVVDMVVVDTLTSLNPKSSMNPSGMLRLALRKWSTLCNQYDSILLGVSQVRFDSTSGATISTSDKAMSVHGLSRLRLNEDGTADTGGRMGYYRSASLDLDMWSDLLDLAVRFGFIKECDYYYEFPSLSRLSRDDALSELATLPPAMLNDLRSLIWEKLNV